MFENQNYLQSYLDTSVYLAIKFYELIGIKFRFSFKRLMIMFNVSDELSLEGKCHIVLGPYGVLHQGMGPNTRFQK